MSLGRGHQDTPRVGVIVTAAGAGLRLGADRPKALVALGARPLLAHALAGVFAAGLNRVVVTAPTTHLPEFRAACQLALPRDAGRETVPDLTVVPGGTTRQASVAQGLAALDDADIVLVHDAARALTPPDMIIRVVAGAQSGAAAVIPGLAVADTIKAVRREDERDVVAATLQRSSLRAIQTPQAFSAAALRDAHALAARRGDVATDDAGLIEELGLPVVVVPGDPRALKITTPFDLEVAEAMVRP
ncbi:MAG: 2-C-methyl-D-erythritol 4-phosphate cytidylyltransferase [Bowdeniella nasicola]|nr:2-C-methyl-D-erythritol 4-phosphate cytidylyltransferase [Bowdeniella nasicola]